MKFLMMAASMRSGSLNKKYIRVADQEFNKLSCETEMIEFENFNSPMYNGDLEDSTGVPTIIKSLSEKIAAADGIVVSSPEYNGSIPGTLKNTLDWLSRLKPVTLKSKPVLLIGASPGALGGVRGNLHTRVPFQILGSYLFPEYLGLSKAHEAFSENGELKDPEQKAKLSKICSDFKAFTEKLKA